MRRERMPPCQPPSPPHYKKINFIVGGSDVCGATYSQAKRIARDSSIHVARADIQVSNIPRVYFNKEDMSSQREPQYDSLVISIPIGNCPIKRVLVDNGSTANIMMLTILKQMGLAESDMSKKTTTLVGFSGETKRTMGEISLPIYAQGVIPSTYQQVTKFPTPWGVQQIPGDQVTTRECYETCLKPSVVHEESIKTVVTVSGPEKLAEVDLVTRDMKVLIGEDLTPTPESNLVDFLTS
ncbi:uncharacterized protein LOC141708052 [Apium graveolens]|uniref:uncharacterized protein LOC141708052 n=1 Tax=Apium graveolens TaxID=4045 RepID=UPI003D7B41AD